MKNRKVCLILVCIIWALLLSCDTSPSGPPGFSGPANPTPGPGGPSCKSVDMYGSVDELHHQVSLIRRDGEQLQHRIEEQVEGFGGLYLDENGAYIAYLKDKSDKSQLNSIIRSFTAPDRIAFEREVIIKKGLFSFGELATWRELITAFLLTSNKFHFVSSVHIHEVVNRVIVGIHQDYWEDKSTDSVKNFIQQTLLIPEEAVVFEKEFDEYEERDDYDFDELTGDTFERQRPIIGGLRISSDSGTCSMGFLGLFDDKPVFVTNGHCTENPHGNSNTLYFQGDRDDLANAVGMEIADGPQSLDKCVTPNSDCWPCRWSDSAIAGIDEHVEHARGYIAKTVRKSEEWMVEGSRIIDEDDPVFTIVDILEDDILTGMSLHKVGGNSGWTSGEVIRTCVDSRRSRHEIILQCQHRARYATSGGGTSGSPVFKRVAGDFEGIENPVALVGIHRASSNRDQANGYSAFSPIDGVLKDFNGLEGLKTEINNNN